MKVSKNEILYIYDSSDIQQREGLIYAKSLRHYETKELDIRHDKITQLQLSNLAEKLGIKAKKLINVDGEIQLSEVMELDSHDFLDYLSSNLEMLKTPIAVYHDHALFVESQYELIKEDGINSRTDVQTSKTLKQRETRD
ncbi:hypothetical protein SAMN05421640_1377 [Ekhidna lutea]|uniref:Arsenate reductase, glutaredoxin family n=1 Tax=Ekhidna lutea TaxID=447679 RepID=A0A239HML9_EKHLU|nr:hypothetical protein [Ekhidna lutea]SNS82093.1 hypothetical protein SAMN05421640_1377 [Ekhidna lutea]